MGNGLGRIHYAKGRSTVRKKYFVSYADLKHGLLESKDTTIYYACPCQWLKLYVYFYHINGNTNNDWEFKNKFLNKVGHVQTGW